MAGNSRIRAHIRGRFRVVLYVFALFMGLIVIRLYMVQVQQRHAWQSRGERNMLRVEAIDSPRGDMVDNRGILLATNRPVFDVYWRGGGSKRFDGRHTSIAQKMYTILCLTEPYDEWISGIRRVEYFGRRLRLAEDISFEQLCQLYEQCFDAPNVLVIHRFKRLYPKGALAAHVLGYLGREGERLYLGRSGLEKELQGSLEGKSGYVVHVVNSVGRYLGERERCLAQAGETVTLTLDAELQEIAEKLLANYQAGACVVMDPADGAILVLASQPSFDPNMFLEPLSQQEWDEWCSARNPMLNRVLHALYPPASIFKLITFTAGLEERIIDPYTQLECKGVTVFGGREYQCIHRKGHGLLSRLDAIAHSCNIHCYDIARRISINQLAQYAFRFGLGQRTGFTIPDKAGLVPTAEWKRALLHEPWWRGETLSACIGQGYLLVTPLQIARLVGGICRGYLVKPRVVVSEEVQTQPLEISTETRALLQQVMRKAVEEGTAHRLAGIRDIEVFVKTGTAQTASLEKSQDDVQLLEHGLVASYFSYKGQRPLVSVVILERTGTSSPALSLTRSLLLAYRNVWRVREAAA